MNILVAEAVNFVQCSVGAITSGTAAFSTTDGSVHLGTNNNGNAITVHGAGAAGADLVTSISGNPGSQTSATLANNAGTTVSAASWLLGAGTSGTNGTTTFTATLAGAVAAGDLIAVGINTDPALTITSVKDQANNSLTGAPQGSQSNADWFQQMFWIQAPASVSAGAYVLTVTLSGTPANDNTEIFVARATAGIPGTWTANASAKTSGNSASVTSGTFSTTIANTIVFNLTGVNSHCTAGGSGYSILPASVQLFNGGGATGVGNPFGDILQYQVFTTTQSSISSAATQSAAGIFVSMSTAFAFTPLTGGILGTQQRAPGFPRTAPLPGIATLGTGILVAKQPSTQQTLNESISESITAPSDSVARAFVGARSIAESITAPSDSVARAFVGSRAISESITAPSDSVSRAFVGARSISESITAPSDSVARATVLARSISESITAPSDSVAIAQVLARSISESITAPTDSVATTITRAAFPTLATQQRTPGFPLAAPLPGIALLGVGLLVAAHIPNLFGAISESITGPSDSVARAFVGARAIAESITGPSDSVARAFVGSRGISESITAPSDSVSRAFVGARSIAESITAPSDSVARATVLARSISESITAPSDAVSRAFVGARSIAESVTAPADAVSRAFVGARSISESVTAPSDAVSRAFVGSRSISESVTAPSDAVARAFVGARSVAESITAPSDSAARAFVGARAVSESVTAPSDSIVRVFVGGRAVAESITAPSDAVVAAQVLTRGISESITAPSDSVAGFVQHGAPSVWLAVQLRSKGFPPTAPLPGIPLLGVGILQAGPTTHAYAGTIAESITAPSDAVARAFVGSRAVAESIAAPSDALSRAFVGSRGISESVTAPSDAVARATVLARSLSESVTAPSDAVARVASASRSVAESIAAPSDAVARQTVEARALAESITAPSDAVGRSTVQVRLFAESITAPTDALSRSFGALRAIAESVAAPSDAITGAQVLARSIAESVGAPSDAVSGVPFHQTVPSVWIGWTQRRAIGFPPGAPLPGIVVLGTGILRAGPTTNSYAGAIAESITTPSDSVSQSFIHIAPASGYRVTTISRQLGVTTSSVQVPP